MFRFPLPLLALLTLSALAFLPPATAREVNVAAVARELDALLAQDWAKQKLQPNPPITDEVFLRRIYLDAVGRIPTYRETDSFLGSTSPHKRAELIDALLASEGYTEHFFNYWADVLRLQSFGQIGPAAGAAYTLYLKESLRTNKRYDQLVRELVASKVRPWDTGVIGYYMRDNKMPLDNFASTARIFLGTRIECTQFTFIE